MASFTTDGRRASTDAGVARRHLPDRRGDDHPALRVGGFCATARGASRTLCAELGGFSLHAATRCRAGDRWRVVRLCRHVKRPAFADDQLDWHGGKRVTFALKTPWREGTTHLKMTPVDVLERLAALVPRPRLHMVRFHGILAQIAKLRALVVPRFVGTISEDTELSAVPRHRHAAKLRFATSWLPPPRTPTPTSG